MDYHLIVDGPLLARRGIWTSMRKSGLKDRSLLERWTLVESLEDPEPDA